MSITEKYSQTDTVGNLPAATKSSEPIPELIIKEATPTAGSEPAKTPTTQKAEGKEASAATASPEPEPPPEPQPDFGNCDLCGDDEPVPAVEIYRSLDNLSRVMPLCNACADYCREADRKRLIRLMSVPNIYHRIWSWKRLLDEPRQVDGRDGAKLVMPNKPDYVKAVKEQFLDNVKYDQTIVIAYIAGLEEKLKRHLAIPEAERQAARKARLDESSPVCVIE